MGASITYQQAKQILGFSDFRMDYWLYHRDEAKRLKPIKPNTKPLLFDRDEVERFQIARLQDQQERTKPKVKRPRGRPQVRDPRNIWRLIAGTTKGRWQLNPDGKAYRLSRRVNAVGEVYTFADIKTGKRKHKRHKLAQDEGASMALLNKLLEAAK